MDEIRCRLISHAVSPHLSQIYTGFYLLARKGKIKLSQHLKKENHYELTKPQHLRDVRSTHLRVIINDRIVAHYDTHDSWEIDERDLTTTDFYFKRSYDPARINGFERLKHQVFPLGLNYPVYPNGFDRLGLIRSVRLARKRKILTEAFRSLHLFKKAFFLSSVDVMEASPIYDTAPSILFMVGAWDPYDNPDRSRQKIKERIQINETRADCIRKLRNAYKERFYGGFVHTKYTYANYRDCLLRDNGQAKKNKYIRLMKSFPICVSTTGLHGSIGWKFGEYVAFSKAILTERLNHQVPGRFEATRNYLEFTSAEDCVEKADRLISDSQIRKSMMSNNRHYYQSYLRPDALILNSLHIALSGKKSNNL